MMKALAILALFASIVVSTITSASIPAGGQTVYYNPTTINLGFARNVGTGLVSGLTVTVVVTNAVTNATLLASTSVPEIASGAGIYNYAWTPGIFVDTACLATYTVGSSKYTEFFFISGDTTGGRAS